MKSDANIPRKAPDPGRNLLDIMTESVNRYVDNYDPCPMCENKTEKGHEEICHDCAYFYPSHFKAKMGNGQERQESE